MGSEDLFHKRRERKTSDFRRKASPTRPVKQVQPRILIVCEDSKSSAYYLEELAKDLGLNAVTIEGKRCGSAPSSVLEFAQKMYEDSVKKREPYESVYCVFDRDQHDCFDETINKITQLKQAKKPFFAITTTPCFEFWLILHFGYNSKSYQVTGNKSPCENANTDLKKTWSDYAKNRRTIYMMTKDKLTTAIVNAKQLASYNATTGSSNPQTNLHELVEYLQSIQR